MSYGGYQQNSYQQGGYGGGRGRGGFGRGGGNGYGGRQQPRQSGAQNGDMTQYPTPPNCYECSHLMTKLNVSNSTGKRYWTCVNPAGGQEHGILWATPTADPNGQLPGAQLPQQQMQQQPMQQAIQQPIQQPIQQQQMQQPQQLQQQMQTAPSQAKSSSDDYLPTVLNTLDELKNELANNFAGLFMRLDEMDEKNKLLLSRVNSLYSAASATLINVKKRKIEDSDQEISQALESSLNTK